MAGAEAGWSKLLRSWSVKRGEGGQGKEEGKVCRWRVDTKPSEYVALSRNRRGSGWPLTEASTGTSAASVDVIKFIARSISI